MQSNKNILVIFPDEAKLVFSKILEKNNLQETDQEFYNYLDSNKETRRMIVRDAVRIMAKKILPEEKLIELLINHLTMQRDLAVKLIQEIKIQLLPLLLVFPEEKLQDPVFQDEVSQKASGVEKLNPSMGVKPIDIKNVEKNAKINEANKKFTQENKNIILENQESKKIEPPNNPTLKKPDSYREPI